MPTQGQRQDYLWRPNDNSSTTITRYDQEAEHWAKAFKSKLAPHNQPSSLSDGFGFIGLLLSFTISLLLVIVLCITDFFNWIRNLFIYKPTYKTEEEGFKAKYNIQEEEPTLTEEEFAIRLEEFRRTGI